MTRATVHFVQPFNSSYRRVNKAGQKNLRCFPAHSPTGHQAARFCGCPIIVQVTTVASANPDVVEYLGELVLASSPARTSISSNSTPLMRGTRRGNSVVFNVDSQVWRYDWVSSFSACRAMHVFRVYVVEGGLVVEVCDSPAFTVSSFRYKNVDEELGILPPMDPLRVVIRAISERVQTVDLDTAENDNDDGSLKDDLVDFLDSASFGVVDDSALLVNAESMDALLEIESLDALLIRSANFIMKHFGTWRDMAALKQDVEMLLATEGSSLQSVSERAEALFGFTAIPPIVQQARSSDLLNLARRIALDILPKGTPLFDEITIGGPNDMSGCYRRSEAYSAYVQEIAARGGEWSSVDLRLKNLDVPYVVFMAASSQLLAMTYRGLENRLGKHVFLKLNAINRPSNFRPLEFRSSSNIVICAWAFQMGVITFTFGLFDGIAVHLYMKDEDRLEAMNVKVIILHSLVTGEYKAEDPPREFVFMPAEVL